MMVDFSMRESILDSKRADSTSADNQCAEYPVKRDPDASDRAMMSSAGMPDWLEPMAATLTQEHRVDGARQARRRARALDARPGL